MGQYLEHPTITPRGDDTPNDTLHIDFNKGKVEFTLAIYTFVDNDTKQYVQYLPSLEMSSYGQTEAQAKAMLDQNVNDFFEHLMALSRKNLQAELTSLGWKQDKLGTKGFSKAYIDINGELKNLNAVDNHVERRILTAA